MWCLPSARLRRILRRPVGEKPVPLQEVALVDDHESVDEAPEATLAGLAPSESIGAVGDRGARPLW